MRPVRAWIGVVIVAVGVVGVLGAVGVIDAGGLLARWWPLAVIGLGLAALIAQRSISPGPLVVAAIGVILLGGAQNWPAQGLVWPVLLIVIGVVVLAGLLRARRSPAPAGSSLAICGGSSVHERSSHFTHAETSAVFGGSTLDLRGASIDEGASVDAFAMFGGVDVLVPEGWRIELRGLPIFGGYEDKTKDDTLPADAPVLTINATAIFGGVSVAHDSRQAKQRAA